MRPPSLIRLAGAASAAALVLLLPGCSGDPFHLMPESASVVADQIDHLTYLIFWLTNATFVGVQIVMLWFLWAYRRKPGVRPAHTHGNHTAEMIWTIAPAAVLVFLALYQMSLWSEVKSSKAPAGAPTREVHVQVLAKQYNWNFRYAGKDGLFGTDDDMVTTSNLVVPKDVTVHLEIRALDVLHSFYLPNFRLKQDAVPGLHSHMWFIPNKLSAERRPFTSLDGKKIPVDFWDIVCAELCGALHTTMAGRLYVVTDAEYEAYVSGKPLTKLRASRASYTSADAEPPQQIQLQPWDRSAVQGLDAFFVQWSAQDVQIATRNPVKPKHPFGSEEKDEE